jgi:hypothetical protein
VKRFVPILLFFILAVPAMAQRGDVVLCEGFYSPWLNEGWDVGGDEWVVWYISNTSYAGSKAHEMQMYPDYNFNGTTLLSSPFVELDKYDYIMLQFNHSVETYDVGRKGVIGIGISQDQEHWESIWSDTITQSILQSQYLLTFDMEPWNNKSNYFCFYYTGDGSCVRNWFLDSIIIFADKKDKYGRIGYDDESGFIAGLSKITSLFGGKEKNMFTKQRRSRNKFAKIVNGNRL